MARRHGVMLGSSTPSRFSRNWISDVWSKISEDTQPPRLQGDTMSRGTRMPKP